MTRYGQDFWEKRRVTVPRTNGAIENDWYFLKIVPACLEIGRFQSYVFVVKEIENGQIEKRIPENIFNLYNPNFLI